MAFQEIINSDKPLPEISLSWARSVVLIYWKKLSDKSARRSLRRNSDMLPFRNFRNCPMIWKYKQDTGQGHSAVSA